MGIAARFDGDRSLVRGDTGTGPSRLGADRDAPSLRGPFPALSTDVRGADFSVFLPFLTGTDPFKVIEARTDEGLVQITGNMITFDVGSDFDNMSVGQSTQVIVDVDVALDGAFYATYPMTLTVTMTDEGLEVEDEYGRTGLGQLTTYGVPLDKFLQEGIGFGPIGATLIDINTDDIKEALAGDLKLARDFALANLQAAEEDVVEAQAALSAAETKLGLASEIVLRDGIYQTAKLAADAAQGAFDIAKAASDEAETLYQDAKAASQSYGNSAEYYAEGVVHITEVLALKTTYDAARLVTIAAQESLDFAIDAVEGAYDLYEEADLAQQAALAAQTVAGTAFNAAQAAVNAAQTAYNSALSVVNAAGDVFFGAVDAVLDVVGWLGVSRQDILDALSTFYSVPGVGPLLRDAVNALSNAESAFNSAINTLNSANSAFNTANQELLQAQAAAQQAVAQAANAFDNYVATAAQYSIDGLEDARDDAAFLENLARQEWLDARQDMWNDGHLVSENPTAGDLAFYTGKAAEFAAAFVAAEAAELAALGAYELAELALIPLQEALDLANSGEAAALGPLNAAKQAYVDAGFFDGSYPGVDDVALLTADAAAKLALLGVAEAEKLVLLGLYEAAELAYELALAVDLGFQIDIEFGFIADADLKLGISTDVGIGAGNTASVVDVVYDTFDDVATVETVRPGNTAALEIGDPFGFFLSILYDIDLSLGVTLDLFVEVGDDVIIDTGGPQLLGFDIDKTGILGLAGFNRFGPASLEGEDTGDTLVFVLDLEDGTQLETGVNDPLIIENASDHDINGDGFVDYAISVEGAGSPLMDALLTAMIEDADQQFQLA